MIWVVYNSVWLANIPHGAFEGSGLEQMFFVACSIFMLVVMMNLLIAIMSDTFNRVKEDAIVAYYRQKAVLIYEVDKLMADEAKDSELFAPYLLFSLVRDESDKSEPGREGADSEPPWSGPQEDPEPTPAPTDQSSTVILKELRAMRKEQQGGQGTRWMAKAAQFNQALDDLQQSVSSAETLDDLRRIQKTLATSTTTG